MNPSHLLQQPPCLDPAVLSDSIVKVLSRSPQTQAYVGQRVAEIVADIFAKPIIVELRQRIEQLGDIIDQMQTKQQRIHARLSKSAAKSTAAQEKLAVTSKNYERDMERLREVEIERNNCVVQIGLLERDIKSKELQMEKMEAKLGEIDNESRDYRQKGEQLGLEVRKLEQLLRQKQEKIRQLTDEQQKVKVSFKSTRYNEASFRKQNQKLEKELKKILKQLKNLEQTHKKQVASRQAQRKTLFAKINQLNSKVRNVTKANKKLLLLDLSNRQLRKCLLELKQDIKMRDKKLYEQARSSCYRIMDEIGDRVNSELKDLMAQIARSNTEIRILREQVKIKQEMIDKLEKTSSVQLMGNKQLQKELKGKKMEVDALRKELKKNYEEAEIKFLGLEHSYRKILSTAVDFPLR